MIYLKSNIKSLEWKSMNKITRFSTIEVEKKSETGLNSGFAPVCWHIKNVVWNTSYKIFLIFLLSSFGR